MQGKTVIFLPMPSVQEQIQTGDGRLLEVSCCSLSGRGWGGRVKERKAERKRRSSKCSSFKIRESRTHVFSV